MLLTEAEIVELTGRVRPTYQRRVLDSLGITSKPRPDGTLVVLREHVATLLGAGGASRVQRTPLPRFEAM